MSKSETKNLIALVEFTKDCDVSELAARLNSLSSGFVFVRDDTGRFEEVPAFTAEFGGASLVLYGSSETENEAGCVLEFSARTTEELEEFRTQVPAFIGRVISAKYTNSRGYLDFSEELANTLSADGFTGCKPVKFG